MAALNTRLPPQVTHEGGPATRNISPEQQLRRTVLSCLLWEDQFYESGAGIVDRLKDICGKCKPETVAAFAIEARTKYNLRHVPLLLVSLLAKLAPGRSLVSETIYSVVRRADELAELLAVHAQVNKVEPGNIKKVISAQMKKGLAKAFTKFNEYSLAKYNRDNGIKLRDVLFLCHAKPLNEDMKNLWKRLIDGELVTPDTWEVALSGGADKREVFTRLLTEGKLGYLALLRNLRNMVQSGVDEKIMTDAILARRNGAEHVLPFRFIAAARAAPSLEPSLDLSLLQSISELDKLTGRTVVLVDVSGSMDTKLSAKSDLTRADAAACLASIINGDVRVFSFSSDVRECPPRRGMAGVDAILRSQSHQSTYLGKALEFVNKTVPHDRIIVITDEQSSDRVPAPVCKKAYMINVASYKNSVSYGAWTHIDGFSEQVLRYINEVERDMDV